MEEFYFLEIDESLLPSYFYLEDDDYCLFYFVYTAKENFRFSDTNSLIWNFKKSLEKKTTNPREWPHKGRAISEIGGHLKKFIDFGIDESFTFVPIPPSKIKTDPEYDDRMNQSLKIACNGRFSATFKEAIITVKNRSASHASDNTRLTPDELLEYLKYNDEVEIDTEIIVIVDDVITTGSQFKACQKILREKYPEKTIWGLFIARTEHNNRSDFDDDFDAIDFLID